MRLSESAPGFGSVQRNCGAHEALQRFAVDRFAFAEVDGAPRVPLEARVEQPGGILERRTFRERHLHDALVRLARADDPVVLPYRDSAPLPLFDDVRVSFLYQRAQPPECLAPPVVEFLDPPVDQLGGRLVRRARHRGAGYPATQRLVPATPDESPEGDQSDQRDDDAEHEAPEQCDDDPDDDQDPADADPTESPSSSSIDGHATPSVGARRLPPRRLRAP